MLNGIENTFSFVGKQMLIRTSEYRSQSPHLSARSEARASSVLHENRFCLTHIYSLVRAIVCVEVLGNVCIGQCFLLWGARHSPRALVLPARLQKSQWSFSHEPRSHAVQTRTYVQALRPTAGTRRQLPYFPRYILKLRTRHG